MKEFLGKIWEGNSVQEYAIVFGQMIIVWILFRLFRKFILSVFKRSALKTPSEVDDAIVAAAEKFIIPYIYFLVNYAIIQQLNFTDHGEHILEVAMAVITAYFFIRFVNHSIYLSVLLYMQRKDEPKERVNHLSGILIVVKVLVWIGGVLILFENLGYNITTIITGLGIGGIAIALAAQNILTDVFSYFVIFFDKPFEVGDAISVNNITGTVEHIGIKTSHIRSVSGEQLIMPNTELVKSTIKNIKRLERRGVSFKLNLRYDTSEEKLKAIPEIIQQIVNKHEHARMERCHLTSLGDYSVGFEVLYFIDSSDYKLYLNIQQQVFLEILDAFIKKGIDFAFPGQTFILQHPFDVEKK
jgi:small-conductance mechanosensitive channel